MTHKAHTANGFAIRPPGLDGDMQEKPTRPPRSSTVKAPGVVARLARNSYLVGNSSRNTDPCKAPADAHKRPLWASTIDRQIDRPTPMPEGFVVKYVSNMRLMLSGSIPVPVSSIDTSKTPRFRYFGFHSQDSQPISYRLHRINGIRDEVHYHLLQLDSIGR